MPHLCFFGLFPGKGQAELRKQTERKLWRNKSGSVSRGHSGLSPVPVALEIGSFPPSSLLCWLLLGGHKHGALHRCRGRKKHREIEMQMLVSEFFPPKGDPVSHAFVRVIK